ncbi:rcc01693 family protein [Frigidibacter sp. MR17.24]|uniref:rcc01693 family protein n=1 Tax=Frigidibacter sp. MR17.24 TaxID=3127345 RepID=UPI003012A7D4
MAERLDWPGMLRAALGGLRLRPEEFWALTPLELALMLGLSGSGGLGRGRLEEMMRAWPDADGRARSQGQPGTGAEDRDGGC